MKYSKPIMTIRELVNEKGYTENYLRDIHGQALIDGETFTWKLNPLKEKSTIVFDTEGLEKYRLSLVKLTRQSLKVGD